jgi:hypothetical protein
MKRTVKLTERRSGLPFELNEDAYALIIRTYQRVYLIKRFYWIASGAGIVLLWYLGYVPWWVIPIVVVILIAVNYVLSLKTLAWLSKKTGIERHDVYGMYLGHLRGNIEGTEEEIAATRRGRDR